MITNPIFQTAGVIDGVGFFSKFIPALITLAFIVGTLVFVGILIMGAIQWISSGSDKQSLEGARSRITNAVIGIIVLFSTYAILSFVGYFFCVNLTSFNVTSLVVMQTSGLGARTCPTVGGTSGTGTGTGTGTGNPLCGGCINAANQCGITGQTYQGAGTQHYFCGVLDGSNGWHPVDGVGNPADPNGGNLSTTCRACP